MHDKTSNTNIHEKAVPYILFSLHMRHYRDGSKRYLGEKKGNFSVNNTESLLL